MFKEIYPLLIAIGLFVYGVSELIRGYKYNKHLQEEDQRSGNYSNGGSMLDEFFRIVVPYLPLKISRYFKILKGFILIFIGSVLFIAFLESAIDFLFN